MSNVILEIQPDKTKSVLEILRNEGYAISADCDGKGNCGKCKVQILKGTASVSKEDKKIFSEKELQEGWRLSCTLYAEEESTIAFQCNNEAEFQVVAEHVPLNMGENVAKNMKRFGNKVAYSIAIDLGTTTIAFQLLDKLSGKILGTVTSVNQQRRYGTDVISRIQASVSGKKEILKNSIRKDLKNGILSLVRESMVGLNQIQSIVIAANTTMGHLLMGYDCSGLGTYPFKPVNIEVITGSAKEILGLQTCNAEVTLLPGISAYVGGDILSGLYACDFYNNDEICLFLDLGTNGEMALGNKDRILVTSTSAGPAFEGGNIAWGMGSVSGAICSVTIQDEKVLVNTIGEKPPRGICGTGVVEAVAELIKTKRINQTGLLLAEYFTEGFPLAYTEDGACIFLTQKDIREFQMAKSAIRAGVEILLRRSGITAEQVSKVYLAGGFGYKLDIRKAIFTGMLPEQLINSVETVGNSSLSGVIKYIIESNGENRLYKMKQIAEEVELSNDKDFDHIFLKNMEF